MSDTFEPHAQPIPQTGSPEWAPGVEDDAAIAAPPRRQGPRDIFFGADGLRAGWSILLFLLIVFLLGFGINAAVKAARHGAPPTPSQKAQTATNVVRNEALSFAVVGVAGFLVSRVERRRFGRYGIGALNAHRLRQFLLGAALGLGLLALLVFALRLTGHIALDGVLLGTHDALLYGLLWFVAFLGVGFFEEFLTRGFLQFTITRGLAGLARTTGISYRTSVVVSFWITALLFSVVFLLGHTGNPGESPFGLASVFMIGLVFAFSLWRTGSLWWAIGYHAAWDWAQSFLFGTADSGILVQKHLLASHPMGRPLLSGGSTGPEGSIFELGEIVVTTLVIWFFLKPEPGSYADPLWTPNDPTHLP